MTTLTSLGKWFIVLIHCLLNGLVVGYIEVSICWFCMVEFFYFTRCLLILQAQGCLVFADGVAKYTTMNLVSLFFCLRRIMRWSTSVFRSLTLLAMCHF